MWRCSAVYHESFQNSLIIHKGKTKEIKTESSRKLSNFYIQWTKTLHQNNSKHIAFLLKSFTRAKEVSNHL